MVEIEQTRDTVVKWLTRTEGKDLEITANLQNTSQISAVLEGLVAKSLGSSVGASESEMLLRLTISMHGRGRDDLTNIGRTPEIQGWKINEHE